MRVLSYPLAYTISVIVLLVVIVNLLSLRHQSFRESPDTDGMNAIAVPPIVTYSGNDAAGMISVSLPIPGQYISSPLMVTGLARGPWYFEASFPVTLTDWDGRIIAQGHAEAQSDWMTEDFVPFTATLEFVQPIFTGEIAFMNRGSLILKNDNPSGDPSRDKSVEIPVLFYPVAK